MNNLKTDKMLTGLYNKTKEELESSILNRASTFTEGYSQAVESLNIMETLAGDLILNNDMKQLQEYF
jgi:hypothetical protein